MNERLLDGLVAAIADAVAERLDAALHDALARVAAPASPWINIDSAAAYLDLPKQRLYKLTAQGALPHYKQDGRLLFHRGELDEWMAQYRQPGDWISTAKRGMCP